MIAETLLPTLELALAADDDFGVPHSLWLEFDQDESNSLGSYPSLFLALGKPALSGDATQLATYLQKLTSVAGSVELPVNLKELLGALAGGESISHVGWMLGRSRPVLRLVIRLSEGANPLETGKRLTGTSPPGTWASLLSELSTDLQYTRLCLDVFPDRLEINGIECFPLDGDQRHEAISRIFATLEYRACCLSEHKERLEDWEGACFPDPDKAWPLAMIWPGLTGSENRFTVFEKSISHFKVAGPETGDLEVKVYWGGEMTHWSLEPPDMESTRDTVPTDFRHSSRLQHMLDFLQACRQNDLVRNALESELNPGLETLTDLGRQFGFDIEPEAFHRAFAVDWHMRWRHLQKTRAPSASTKD